jgi:hypothetical protein
MAMIGGGGGGGVGEGLVAGRRRFRSAAGLVVVPAFSAETNWENMMEKWEVGGALAACRLREVFFLARTGPCGPHGHFPSWPIPIILCPGKVPNHNIFIIFVIIPITSSESNFRNYLAPVCILSFF